MKTALAPLFAAFLIGSAGAAVAQPGPSGFMAELTEADRGRISRFDEALGRALTDATVGGGDIADIRRLQRAIGGEPLPAPGDRLVGAWYCRTIKIGKNLPLVVYTFFGCTIEEDADGLKLVKTTGSQRTSGRLYPLDSDAWGFAGALHFQDEEPLAYGTQAERDMVGRLVRNGPARLWLGLPEPNVESRFDVLELVRELDEQ